MLLTAEGARVKLADFDSAKRLQHELTEAGLKPLGTKGFVSPEVKTGISLSLETCMGLRFFYTYFVHFGVVFLEKAIRGFQMF